MTGMADDAVPEVDEAGERSQLPGWRTGVIPGWMLIVGLVVLAVAGLGLASIGSAAGIAAVAVLEAAVVALLFSWVSSTAPR
jgi:hypothetical protein